MDQSKSIDGQCDPKSSSVDLSDYEDLVWHRVAEQGFRMPEDHWSAPNTWFWRQKHGWRVWDADGNEFWLCKLCHGQRSFKQHWFKSAKSTMRAKEHLKAVHHIGSGGLTSELAKPRKKRKFDRNIRDDDNINTPTVMRSVWPKSHGVMASLMQGIIAGHIALQDIDSPYLQQLVKCASPQTRPLSFTTISDCITRMYDRQLRIAADLVASSSSKISLSFQKYASRAGVRLLGAGTFFIDSGGRPKSMFVSLPRGQTRYKACNVPETVSAIVAEYNLGASLGYIITKDNSRMSTLAYGHQSIGDDRWIHCLGHFLNLVAQSVLFGGAANALEGELVTAGNDELQHKKVWRRRGPCGRLRNIVSCIKGCSQLETTFEDIQRHLDAGAFLVGEADVLKLVQVEDTRWESMHNSLERALHLRLALDEFMGLEIDGQCDSCRCKSDGSQLSIADDYLLPHDWEVLKAYHEVIQQVKEAMDILQKKVESHLGAIWQVLPQLEALLVCLDDSRQQKLSQGEGQATSARPQDVRDDHSSRRSIAGQKHTEAGRMNTVSPPQDATAREEKQTALQHRLNTNFNRVFAQHEFRSNISTAWQKVHDFCEALYGNILYVAAVVLHPRIKWRFFETRWKDCKDRLSTMRETLSEYWRNNYRDTLARSHLRSRAVSCEDDRALSWLVSQRSNLLGSQKTTR